MEQPMSFGLRHSQQNADHLHRQFGGDFDQKVERLAWLNRIQQAACPHPQIVLHPGDHSRCQPRTDQPANLRVSRVVHHVQHLPRDRQILQQRATERPRAPGNRGKSQRITKHRKGFRVCGH
jgi:hypothetical protein